MNDYELITTALKKIKKIERLRGKATDWAWKVDDYWRIFINRIESLESLQYKVLEELIELTKKEK